MSGPVHLGLELSPEPDALARALGVVLTAQADIRAAAYVSGPDCGRLVLTIDGLATERAEALSRRLQALPCVRGLQSPGLGVRAGRNVLAQRDKSQMFG
jgi:hypothetical protein